MLSVPSVSTSSVSSTGVRTLPSGAIPATYTPATALSVEQGLKRATAQQQEYLNEAKALYEPYMNAGVESLDEYMRLLKGGVDSLSTDNNFKQLQDLAEKKVMANRATSGLLRSGATTSALEDTLLNFSNDYYGNRLDQLRQGVGIGQYGTTGETSVLDKLGTSGTDLAEALANIQMNREANEAIIKAAQMEADAAKKAAKKAGKSSLWGGIGTVAGGIIGSVGGPAGAYIGSQIGGALGSSIGYQ